MPIYTQAQLSSDVNGKIKGKIGILVDPQSTLNQGVRQVLMDNDMDLTSTRRRSPLVPNLFSGLFEYAAPADLKGYKVIGIQNQKFNRTTNWGLVPFEEFMRLQDSNSIAISDYDFIKKILIKTHINDIKSVLSNLDTLSAGGGTWGLFGDAVNVHKTTDNFIQGAGAIGFDISAAAGLTAGIENSTLNQDDLSAYFEGDGNILIWVYITSVTDLTSFSIRVGSDAANYFTKTTTTQADGTAFINGWNLLNFNLTIFPAVGAPVNTAIDYFAIFMTKLATKISETGFRFNGIVFRRGEINNLYYYSKYGWQSSLGVYKENSTISSDLLNADTEEYELIKTKCAELAADEADEEKVSLKEAANYERLKKAYKMNHPSEALTMISTTANFVRL